MIDQDRLTMASRTALDHGLRVLQGFRLAPNDREHINKLLEYMDPAPGTTWLDIGCGFGEPARLMREVRPDLRFWLINNNLYQLEQVPAISMMPAFFADMYELPFPEASADGAMFLYSLCHADNKALVLREAARVVRPGGELFVFDYFRTGGEGRLAMRYLSASFVSGANFDALAESAGWDLMEQVFPDGDDTLFRSLFEDQELYYEIFKDLVPVIWKAVRR
jgi:ubiquinone/menaquinone biosynthesis C-methylase UbiE